MKYNFQVGDLLVARYHGCPTHVGIIIKFNDKLTYPYLIEWNDNTSGHFKEYEILDLIKGNTITYFPIVK
jgi:hypothetical protein